MNIDNPLPGIESYNDNMNPTLRSHNSPFDLPFYNTRESLQDIDSYRNFLKNAESRFRNSVRYKKYKSFLHEIGLNRCQVHGYISTDMGDDVTIEMHHAILNLFDICLMITESVLNTVGYVTTFDVVNLLKQEHSEHNIALVMLTKTPHQMYTYNDGLFYIHPNMCFGKWPVLIEKYKNGLTQDIAFKLLYYLRKSLELSETQDSGLLNLRDMIVDWSGNNI